MTTAKGRSRDGAGLAFGGARAKILKARLKAAVAEHQRTGKSTLFSTNHASSETRGKGPAREP